MTFGTALLTNKAPDILIVDDTPVNLNVLSAMLTPLGYTVRPAINGELALIAARKMPPDLILLDIRMPEMDGYAVCNALKADDRTRNIPVIFISSLNDIEDKLKAFAVGGVDYINKPFYLEEVLARVESHLVLHRQRREIEMLQAKEHAYYEELGRLKDEMINTASHDLRNPLMIVTGYAGVLEALESVRNDAEALNYVHEIQRGAQRMTKLITNLLDLAQLETGMAIRREPIQLTRFLEEALSEVVLQAQQKEITLHFSPPDHNLTISLDRSKLGQVLNNLLSNAIKYTLPHGQVTLSASLSTETHPDPESDTEYQDHHQHVILTVADTGLGISEEDLPHIFERFFRIQDATHMVQEGTGLGLSIVKSIVDQHQGNISVESVIGQGSTFTVTLPILT